MAHLKNADTGNAEDMGRQLRSMFMSSKPEKFGFTPTDQFPEVFGVAMDWTTGDHIATLAAMSDGHASLYTTSTFGVIGGINNDSVRNEAKTFVQVAQSYARHARETTSYPYPGPNVVRFFFLTYQGVKALDVKREDIMEGSGPVIPLFSQGQRVVTRLRYMMKEEKNGLPSSANQPSEDHSESSYINCLLTLMGEGCLSTISLYAHEPVPDLGEFTRESPEQHEWVLQYDFTYPSMDPAIIIHHLQKTAKRKGFSFLKKQGVIQSVIPMSNGRVKACIFDITFSRANSSAHITLAPNYDPRVISLQRETHQRYGLK